MEIKRDGFFAAVAYWDDTKMPEQTTLCIFWWRFVLLLIPSLAVAVVVVAFLIVLSVLGLLFGQRVDLNNINPGEPPFIKMKKWPTVFGLRAWPFTILVLFFAGKWVVPVWAWVAPRFSSWIYMLATSPRTLQVILVVGVVSMLTLALLGLRRTAFWSMTKEFFKAKKEKVCPIVYIR